MDTKWLNELKDYFSYEVPVGLFLIFVFLVLCVYIIATKHIRKSMTLAMEAFKENNASVMQHNEQLMKDNNELREKNTNLMEEISNLRIGNDQQVEIR